MMGRGGTAPDPLVWNQGGPKKSRKLDIRVNVDLASLPGFMVVVLLVLILLPGLIVLAFCVSLQLFLGSLHWLVDAVDLGPFGWCFFFEASDPF